MKKHLHFITVLLFTAVSTFAQNVVITYNIQDIFTHDIETAGRIITQVIGCSTETTFAQFNGNAESPEIIVPFRLQNITEPLIKTKYPVSNYDINDLTTELYLALISSNSGSKTIKT